MGRDGMVGIDGMDGFGGFEKEQEITLEILPRYLFLTEMGEK